MATWRYFDDPRAQPGNVIMLDHKYKPSFFRRRRLDLASWISRFGIRVSRWVAGRGHSPLIDKTIWW